LKKEKETISKISDQMMESLNNGTKFLENLENIKKSD
jgi:hypothetical protein